MTLRASLLLAALCLASPLAAEEAPPPATPAPVVTEILSFESPVIRSYPGVVAATNEVTMAFQLGGLMVERAVDLGDPVLSGEPLALLDQTSLAEDVAAAQANLRAAEAQAQAAQLSYQRAQTLNARGVAAAAQLEAALAAQDTTNAAVEAARASLAQAEDAQRFSGLVAPGDGIVTAIHAEAGTVVAAGQPIVTLAISDAREVVIDVPSLQLPLFGPQSRFVIISRDGLSEAGGHLRLVAPVTDRAARTHRIHIALDSADMRIGSLVSVQLDIDAAQVLSLPTSAITAAGTVWRVTADRLLEEVAVTWGEELDGRRIVLSGLSRGDEVLVRGLDAAREGLQVGERIEE